MTQPPQQPFPPNYPPQHPQQIPQYPGYYYSPPPDPLAPAKRASVLMFIIGALSFCCGLCMGGVGTMWKAMAQQNPEAVQPMEEAFRKIHISPAAAFGIMAVVTILPGVLYIVLGLFVRRGSMGAIIGAIVVNSLMILLCLFVIVTGVIGGGSPAGICLYILPLALTVWLLVWLIQSARAASRYASSAAHYQQQYWMHQQQQYQQQQQQQQQPPPLPQQQMPPPPTFNNPPPPSSQPPSDPNAPPSQG